MSKRSELPGIQTMIGVQVTVEFEGETYLGTLDGITPSLTAGVGKLLWIVPSDMPGTIRRFPLDAVNISPRDQEEA